MSIRLTSLALWQSNDYLGASKTTLMNMDKYFMWIHYERLHNHNKAKHNKTVCIFLGIYCNYNWRIVLNWVLLWGKGSHLERPDSQSSTSHSLTSFQKWSTLQWCHNERGSVSNHQPYDCLLNRLFRRRSKKRSKLLVTGLWAGKSPVTREFPAQMASNAENVSIWWRHHDLHTLTTTWNGLQLAGGQELGPDSI